MTRLCVSILVRDPAEATARALMAIERGADLVEFRVDGFCDPSELDSLPKIPAIVTCRAAWEGGECELPESERIAILRAAGQMFPYVDLELEAIRRRPDVIEKLGLTRLEDGRCRGLIVSAHDFGGRPARLANLANELENGPGEINKLAWMARSIRDNLEAFELLKALSKPTIALCMGEAGLASRLLAQKFNAFLTFVAMDEKSATAPGQPTLEQIKRLYRWDAVKKSTRVYGVVAQPVMHSMSPAIHNAGFETIGFDGVYLPLLVEGSYVSFKAFMESFVAFNGLDLSGLSITLPHKEHALQYLTEKGAKVEELAARIGAVNSIVVDQNQEGAIRLEGFNTDYAAILDCITGALSITRDELRGVRIAVLGAGGTGRTAVAALAHCGADVTIYNRSLQKAQALALEFDRRVGSVAARPMSEFAKPGQTPDQVYVNTTSVGMYPNVDEIPWGAQRPDLSHNTLVFDTIYNPIETRLLRESRQAGAKTVGGIEMFVRQAAGQFKRWTAVPAPVGVMRQVVEARLRR